MRFLITTFAVLCAAGVLSAETVNFDETPSGKLPAGWAQGVTGKGKAKWAVVAEPTAPSKPKTLKQSGEGTFPWCVKKDVSLEDGFVEVKFKALSGDEDQAAGIVWRFKDGDNYYVARANALESNVSVYYTENGKRKTILYVQGKEGGFSVNLNQWHALRVEFQGPRAQVLLDGKNVVDIQDGHIQGPGAVGLWTKADSVTLFDDFVFEEKKQ